MKTLYLGCRKNKDIRARHNKLARAELYLILKLIFGDNLQKVQN